MTTQKTVSIAVPMAIATKSLVSIITTYLPPAKQDEEITGRLAVAES